MQQTVRPSVGWEEIAAVDHRTTTATTRAAPRGAADVNRASRAGFRRGPATLPRRSHHATHRPDYGLLIAVTALIILGLDMVYSASFVIAQNSPEYQSDTYFLTRQLMWTAIGAVGLIFFTRFDYQALGRLSVLGVGIVFILLCAVLISNAGHAAYGAQRWLKVGPLPPIQPSEFAKLALIVYHANWLARRGERITKFAEGSLPFALTVAVFGGLVVKQPDLGSTFVITLTAFCLFFVAGARLSHLLLGLVAGSVALVVMILTAEYRSQRLLAYLAPESDPLGIGWQTLQASIALGSGGFAGLGLGASRQKFYYLPAAHTDAVFAVIGEELGFIGTVGTLLLFGVVAYRGYRIAMEAPDAFGSLLAAGITCWLTFQALLNIAVVTAIVPFTGIPLPFVSFGGSSMIVSMSAIGVLLNISRHRTGERVLRGRTRPPVGAPGFEGA